MSFYQSFAPKSVAVTSVAIASLILAGCGDKDGSKAYREGENAFAIRDFARASRAFTKATTIATTNPDAWMMLARTQLAIGDLPSARRAAEEAAKLASSDSDVIEIIGQIAYHAKDYSKTRDAYQMLTNEKFSPAIRARGFCGLAIADMAEIAGNNAAEKHARARANLLTAIRLNGNFASARYHLGRLYRDSFDYREAALDQFELFVRLETEETERVQRVQRRVIPELKESIARSAASIPGADRRDSVASATALKKAEDAWRKGNYKTAKQAYKEALDADVLSYPAASGLAKAMEKTDGTRNGLRDALKQYRAASLLRPTARDTLIKVGDLAMNTGNFAMAVEGYSRAMAARPNDISAIDGLIRALQKSGDTKLATVYQKYRDNLPKKTR